MRICIISDRGDEINMNEMERSYSKHGRDEKCKQNFGWKALGQGPVTASCGYGNKSSGSLSGRKCLG